MIELIITIAVLSTGIIGVYSAFYPMLLLTNNLSLRFTGAYLAQEGLEVVRNIRDDNFLRHAKDPLISWSDGLLNCQIGCQLDYKTGTLAQADQDQLAPYDPNHFLAINREGFYGYDGGMSKKFRRKITIDPISKDILKVSVVVDWNYNGKVSSFQVQEYLYNYW